ncbi:MAG: hypothetical protein AAGC57_15665 [Pseudomonadota bacterium]
MAAAPVTPSFQRFGDLPQATFGDTGIPTDPTAIRVFDGLDGDTVTLGLSATERFATPAVETDGRET